MPKKELASGNSDKSFYTIFSDRDYIKRNIEEYKKGTSSIVKEMNKKGYSPQYMIDYYQKELEQYKKGDIMIFVNGNNSELGQELLNLIDSSGYFISIAGSFENKIKDKNKIKDYVLKNINISLSIELL